MSFNLTHDVNPDDSNDESEFKIVTPLPVWEDDAPFDEALNCYGVVFVRIRSAQRLPCPVGSSVVGTASLPPFAGKVKTNRTVAFLHPLDHGVCAQWDQSTDSGFCSMVNAWNSRDSPVPSIKIALMFSPLAIGLLDFTMCNLTLSCEPLMKAPGEWKSQWCQAEVPATLNGSIDHSHSRIPLIHVDCMFLPTNDDHSKKPSGFLGSAQRYYAALSGKETETNTFGKDGKGLLWKQQNEEVSIKSIHVPFQGKPDPDVSVGSDTTEDSSPHHLLRVTSFWVPSTCSVCSSVMVGRNSGFHCEVCSIPCCSDCRLNVNLKMPCGSDDARAFVEQSIQNKMSVNNILSIVAPDEQYLERRKNSDHMVDAVGARRSDGTSQRDKEKVQGIGKVSVEFLRARLFEHSLSPNESPDSVFSNSFPAREGEYYARITSSVNPSKMSRTRPVYAGTPHFNSTKAEFTVKHYGEEFRIDCVDASTDEIIGSAMLSVQGILQNQRDRLIARNGASLLQFIFGPLVSKEKMNAKLELREGLKDTFGLDFLIPRHEPEKREEKHVSTNRGAISGWIEVVIGLEEFVDLLYDPLSAIECPPRPPTDLNMSTFQAHIVRATRLVNKVSSAIESYKFIVSWKDPIVTGLSLLLLVGLCLRFDAEYIGSLPIFGMMLLSVSCSIRQSKSGRKHFIIQAEIKESRKTAKIAVPFETHRPFGIVTVSIRKGCALFSQEFGIPGGASCHVFFDALRLANSQEKKEAVTFNAALDFQREIGSTATILSADPDWKGQHFDSLENRRMKQLLRQANDFLTNEDDSIQPSLLFPVLQPITLKSRRKAPSGRFVDCVLQPWDSSTGAVVLQIRLTLGFDQVLGEIVVPIRQLVTKREVSGWFQVLQPGTAEASIMMDEDGKETETPRVWANLRWTTSVTNVVDDDTDREISNAIQEELVRSSRISKQTRFDLLGNSIGAVNTALGLSGNVQLVQNTLGAMLDSVEWMLNIFNFTDPFKSSFIFLVLCLIWLVLAVIRTRYIILFAVLGQFGSTFFAKYSYFFTADSTKPSVHPKSEHKTSAKADTRDPGNVRKVLLNAIHSLPTDEDLRRAYFWESRRLGAREMEKDDSLKRESRLRRLWRAQWHSEVRIFANKNQEKPEIETGHKQPRTAFAVVAGRRFIWWRSVTDFDEGELAAGLVCLSGHAGLANPSPIEIREVPKECLESAVTVFGKGLNGQQRITIILPDITVKQALETTLYALSRKED